MSLYSGSLFVPFSLREHNVDLLQNTEICRSATRCICIILFLFSKFSNLFIVIKHATSKTKSVQNRTEPPICQRTHVVSSYDGKSESRDRK